MAKIDFDKLSDLQKAQLVDNRWASSSTIWDKIQQIYAANTRVYENRGDWLDNIPYKRKPWQVQANRVFVNMEAVINSLIANPAGINLLPAREGVEFQEFASKMENYFRKKFADLNFKETLRMGLRNLYFGRFLVIKAYWDSELNDFAFRALDPRKVRIAKYARNEIESEFAIEEIPDNLCAMTERFPKKKAELMKLYGFSNDAAGEADMYIKNPDVTYQEAWIQDHVIFKLRNLVLDCIPDPYWDWDGILITEDEEQQLKNAPTEQRKQLLTPIKLDQGNRQAAMAQANQPVPENPEGQTEGYGENQMEGQTEAAPNYKSYYFNYFDTPRKPYVVATIFNNENSPIGRTDMITLSTDLQRGVDKRKMDIDENCEMVNGMLKVDAEVMGKADAQRIRFETKGIIWGKGVKDGVTRETGAALPQMVFDDMVDSRNEIDNIMAATSAFKGERQGQETKAGRLALIQQSYLRLNELVQVVDYVSKECFEWAIQLAKTRYTEPHYAKWMGDADAQQVIEILQDDFETGQEVTVIAGKSLPKDDEFKFEQAQNDVVAGLISPVDYVRIAQYDDPKEIAKNNVLYKQNPVSAVGLAPEKVPLPAQPGDFQPDQMEAILRHGQPGGAPAAANSAPVPAQPQPPAPVGVPQ